MKKTLIAVAALAATASFAQVSVYGRLDVGYGNHTITSGATETKLNGVESAGSISSLWGIKGSEDLGGGLKAIFALESDVYVANGNIGVSGAGNGATGAAAFNRVSNLGLTGGFGTVTLGRNSSPMFGLISGSTVGGATRLDTTGLAAAGGGGSSYPNSVVYTTPNLSGFSATVLYHGQDRSVDSSDIKTNVTMLTATYSNGPLMVGLGTSTGKNTAGTAESKDVGTALVASYNFGVAKVSGNSVTRKQTTSAGFEQEDKEINVAVSAPMGKVTLLAQVGNNTRTNSTGGDSKGQDMMLGADYSLSKSTAAYFRTGTASKLDASTTINESKTTGTIVGLRTVF